VAPHGDDLSVVLTMIIAFITAGLIVGVLTQVVARARDLAVTTAVSAVMVVHLRGVHAVCHVMSLGAFYGD